jgi:ABC-type lipoprotein export system ATPase subunit
VTHDAQIAGYADREVLVSDGQVSAQLNVGGSR